VTILCGGATGDIIKIMMTHAGGECRFKRQDRAALFCDTANEDGFSQSVSCANENFGVRLGGFVNINNSTK
jgi:hypothetical protein